MELDVGRLDMLVVSHDTHGYQRGHTDTPHLRFLAFDFQVPFHIHGMADVLVKDEWHPGKIGEGDPACYQSGWSAEVGGCLDHGEKAGYIHSKWSKRQLNVVVMLQLSTTYS